MADNFNRDCDRILRYLFDNPSANNLEISEGLSMDLGRVQAVLVLLVQAGLINDVKV